MNNSILFNRKVKLQWRGRNRIAISPLEALPEPANLDAVKAEIGDRWDITSLLDVVVETALRTGFLDEFRTSGDRVILDPETLRRRLVLCLYGIGTNAGLKRISAATDGVTYAELLLSSANRFLHKEALRSASALVSNAILAIRNPARSGGEAGTACASTPRSSAPGTGTWSLEWHRRYRGPGVMIYWQYRAPLELHLLPAEALLLLSKSEPRSRACCGHLHRHDDPAPVRRQPRPERGGFRFLVGC